MLDAWFGRAFSRAVSGRFGSAKEMSAAFEAASKDEPLPSLPPESVSITSKPSAGLSAIARLSAAAPDITPGAVNLRSAETREEEATVKRDSNEPEPPEGRAKRPEDRTTKPETDRAVEAQAPQHALETPRSSTPMTMGEPTLSHGTVTHIEATHPRRTKLYGGLIAAVAIGGALTVGLLSRGEDSKDPSGARPTTSATSDAAGAATGAARPPEPGATAAANATPSSTAASTAPALSATSGAPAASQAKSAAPAASASGPKKKKERGF